MTLLHIQILCLGISVPVIARHGLIRYWKEQEKQLQKKITRKGVNNAIFRLFMILKKTIIWSCALALFILITEFNEMPTNPESGFDLLLYEPFYLAFPLLIACMFMYINRSFVNTSYNKKTIIKIILLAAYALVFSIFWMVVVFLLLIQIHLSLGGIL